MLNLEHLVVEVASGKDIMQEIQRRAEQTWGDRWVLNLAREYVKIAQARGDEKATVVNRRRQIERAFEAGSCTLDTAMMLAAAVGCRFQMVCTQVEVKTF